MDIQRKIEILGESAQHDICIACGTHANRRVDDIGRWIYPAVLPDGRRINQLKILQTNVCRNDCYYCAQRAGRDSQRTAFTPDELATTFDKLYRKGLVRGLFLSSAIAGNAESSMDRMLATVELLRHRYRFPGYIHLKILPGVSMAHVEQAVRLASRVSINLEVPSPDFLKCIAPDKQFEQLIKPMEWANQLIRASGRMLVPAGQTTQFLVGAAKESDSDILSATNRLYRDMNLRRVYFSAFQPIEHTPLEEMPSTLPLREHRLYQSDFLLRQYGFRLEDLIFDDKGLLPLEADPKQIWAKQHPEIFPVDLRQASQELLLRVPGIGPKSASRIVKERKERSFRTLRDLEKIGVVANRVAPYILLDGKRPAYQLNLW